MKVGGYDAQHYLSSAIAHVDDSCDDGICDTDSERDRYLAIGLIQAIVGLALAFADAKGGE